MKTVQWFAYSKGETKFFTAPNIELGDDIADGLEAFHQAYPDVSNEWVENMTWILPVRLMPEELR